MYPDSFLQWLGYTAVIFGVLGFVGIIAFSVDDRIKQWEEKQERKKNEKGEINTAFGLLALTALLVTLGCWLYVNEHVGAAQFLWVLASGTAGAGCVLWIEK